MSSTYTASLELKSAIETRFGSYGQAANLYYLNIPSSPTYPLLTYKYDRAAPDNTFADKGEVYNVQFFIYSDTSTYTQVEQYYESLRQLYDDCASSLSMTNWDCNCVNFEAMGEDKYDSTSSLWIKCVQYKIYVQQK